MRNHDGSLNGERRAPRVGRADGPARLAALLLALAACAAPPLADRGGQVGAGGSAPGSARNVVLFIGDGMGISTVTAARILEGQLRGEPGEENLLAFERLPYVALSKTYNTDQQVPDSAGTATAMLTGTKTRAGVISVAPGVARGDAAGAVGHALTTLLERAEARGLATGVVTTTRVTHATPACSYAHSPERDWEVDARLSESARAAGFPDIARQLLEFPYGDGLDVVLGGGRAFFLPARAQAGDGSARGDRLDGRDLLAEWRARGPRAAVVTTRSELLAVDPAQAQPLLGLFAPSHLAYSTEPASETEQPTLAEMTAAALGQLERAPHGFVLLVEGGRIDHGHHDGNAYHALHDTIAFSDAVRTALERVDLAETLVVVTADHSHQFTLGGYPTRGNPILGLVVENDARGEPESQPARDATGLPFTTLGYRDGPGYPGASNTQPEGVKHDPHEFERIEGVRHGRPDLGDVDTADPTYLQEAAIPQHYESHGGEDVAIYAGGAGAQRFHGVQEQSYIYHAIVAALGWDDEAKEAAKRPAN